MQVRERVLQKVRVSVNDAVRVTCKIHSGTKEFSFVTRHEMHDKYGIWDYNRGSRRSGRKENPMSKIPKPHEIYKHFKGSLYQILAVAEHTETGESLVVYQAMYGESKIYARPLENFLEKLDREKYPSAEQTFRFELQEKAEGEQELNIDPMVLAFLDAGSYEERLQILGNLHNRITDDMITTMAVACDIEVPDGDLEERYLGLKSCLLTLERFECNRLR